MSIKVEWRKQGYQFEAENSVGGKIRMDGDGVLQGIEGDVIDANLITLRGGDSVDADADDDAVETLR